LITDPQPLRLDDLADDPRSIGFPSGHPPMRGFLGVPVRVRGHVYGNIYLTEKRDGSPFTAEDEELLTALAGAAAVAIDNAQHYTESQRRQRWLQLSADVTTQLLGATDNPLALLAERARNAAEADLCLVWVAAGDDGAKLRVAAADGIHASVLRGITVSRRDSSIARVLDDQQAIAANDEAAHDQACAERGVAISSVVAAPLPGAGPMDGVLALYRLSGGQPFPSDVLDMTAMLAHQVGVALHLAAAQWELRNLEILEERERIGHELHDQVIGRLFAAGLSMQGLAGRLESPEVQAQVTAHVEELDDIIATIRRNVFALQRGDG
jgi:GAF domain-containing protein